MLVPVDPLDVDRLAVDEQLPVRQLNFSETEFALFDFYDISAVVLESQQHLIKIRRLCRPFVRIAHRRLHSYIDPLINRDPADIFCHQWIRSNDHAVCVKKCDLKAVCPCCCGSIVLQVHIDIKRCIGITAVHITSHKEVSHMNRWRREKIHITIDAAQSPHVLIFKITAVGPSINLSSEHICAS